MAPDNNTIYTTRDSGWASAAVWWLEPVGLLKGCVHTNMHTGLSCEVVCPTSEPLHTQLNMLAVYTGTPAVFRQLVMVR